MLHRSQQAVLLLQQSSRLPHESHLAARPLQPSMGALLVVQKATCMVRQSSASPSKALQTVSMGTATQSQLPRLQRDQQPEVRLRATLTWPARTPPSTRSQRPNLMCPDHTPHSIATALCLVRRPEPAQALPSTASQSPHTTLAVQPHAERPRRGAARCSTTHR